MTISEEVLQTCQQLYEYKEKIDGVAIQINGGEKVFGEISLQLTHSSLLECSFQRTVSWLYTLYWEVGRRSDIGFLVELLNTYELDLSGRLTEHFNIVRSLRTFLQHNIATPDTHNNKIQRICVEWFEASCGTSIPKCDQAWESCLSNLLSEAKQFLEAILECIRAIESDESRDEILYQWSIRRKRYYSPWDYDNLIREVMGDLGLNKDVVNIRNKYQTQWNNFLKNLSIQSDFKTELKKRILNTLLEDQEMLMPLLPIDIIETFGIAAGSPQIYQLLAKAKKIYKADSSLSKDKLLDMLKSEGF